MAINTNGGTNSFANVLLDSLEKLFREFEERFSRLGIAVSLNEILGRYHEAIDMIILREEDTNKCEYISGEFRIIARDAENYECSYSLYFEDADETVHTLEANTKLLPIKYLTEDFQQILRKDSILKYEIDEPSAESRAKYAAKVQATTKMQTAIESAPLWKMPTEK